MLLSLTAATDTSLYEVLNVQAPNPSNSQNQKKENQSLQQKMLEQQESRAAEAAGAKSEAELEVKSLDLKHNWVFVDLQLHKILAISSDTVH